MIPWELLPVAFSIGAAIGGVLGNARGREKNEDYHAALERSGVAEYFRNLEESDHKH